MAIISIKKLSESLQILVQNIHGILIIKYIIKSNPPFQYDIGDALIGCLGNKTDVNCLRNSTASLGDLTGRDTRRGSGPPAVTSANVTNGGVNNSVKLFEVEKWCFKEGIRHYTVSAATGDNIHTAIEQLVKLRLRKLGEDHLIETQ